MSSGSLAGFPVVDVKATLYDGSYHDVDSSVLAFQVHPRPAHLWCLLAPDEEKCRQLPPLPPPLDSRLCSPWHRAAGNRAAACAHRGCLRLLLMPAVLCRVLPCRLLLAWPSARA